MPKIACIANIWMGDIYVHITYENNHSKNRQNSKNDWKMGHPVCVCVLVWKPRPVPLDHPGTSQGTSTLNGEYLRIGTRSQAGLVSHSSNKKRNNMTKSCRMQLVQNGTIGALKRIHPVGNSLIQDNFFPGRTLCLPSSWSAMVNIYSVLTVTWLLLRACHAASTNYDYIIVGGGTSGLLLAVLLSDNPNTTIAVLEAGADARTDPRITIPENAGGIVGTGYDWNLTSTPQAHLSRNKSVIAYGRGRTLGRCSAMNFMINHRASAVEFDAWEGVLNVSGWNSGVLFEAFTASESFAGPAAATMLEAQGPIAGSMAKEVYSLFSDYVVPSLEEVGVPKLVDANGGYTKGVRYDPFALNASSYTRSYAGSAYTNVEDRSNLVVLANATVTRLVWADRLSSEGLVVANGVEYLDPKTGNPAILNGTNVILSAGALMSPPLLEVSGVGDPSLLSVLGVPVVVDLPAVGTQLQDRHGAHAVGCRRAVSRVQLVLWVDVGVSASPSEQRLCSRRLRIDAVAYASDRPSLLQRGANQWDVLRPVAAGQRSALLRPHGGICGSSGLHWGAIQRPGPSRIRGFSRQDL